MNQKIDRIRQILVVLVLIAAVEGFSSCEKIAYTIPVVDQNTIWQFQKDIQPIFTANCTTCHGAIKAPDLRDGKSYLALTKGAYVSSPGESSKLYTKMISPDHAPRSSNIDKQKVLSWINQGALNN